jgi:glycerol dehydrogenase
MKAAEAACAEDETIYNEPMPVGPTMVLSALKTANAYGEERKTVLNR